MLDAARRSRIDALLARCTDGARMMVADPVGGGCISRTLRLTLADGGRVFLKIAESHDPALLAAEAASLELLRATGTVRVPAVLAQQDDLLLLEWLEPGTGDPAAWAGLGRALAALHRSRGAWGGVPDNFIGALPQSNAPAEDWASFWAARRLEPQLRLAGAHLGPEDRRRFAALLPRLPDLLGVGEAEGPSLLHGDLWSGNVHLLASGGAALVDPASCYGHREVDLAMAELFGGFAPAFRAAYEEAWPLAADWPRRRAVYQLYYLLVHVNLFGSGYLTRTRETLRAAGF
jgi:fructosamine-3-kinase